MVVKAPQRYSYSIWVGPRPIEWCYTTVVAKHVFCLACIEGVGAKHIFPVGNSESFLRYYHMHIPLHEAYATIAVPSY